MPSPFAIITSLLLASCAGAAAISSPTKPAAPASPITLASMLQEMVDVEAIARWPEVEYTCKQASSYDRQKVAPDKPGWFANNDFSQFIRTEDNQGRKEQVMLDVDGPGALVRFWLTAGDQKDGVLRIYLDGGKEPAITFPAYDLLKGDLRMQAPLEQPHPGYSATGGGNTLFLPIPYASHCKVTWEEKSRGARYYHLNYRTYKSGTPVQTFTREQLEAVRPLVDAVCKTLESPSVFAAGNVTSLNQDLASGKESSIELPQGPAAIRSLELRLETGDEAHAEQALRSTIVKLIFDGETTVWCPATDFFGSGVGINTLHSWYRSVNADDGVMRCRWVMPYHHSARVSLINAGAQPIDVTLHTITSPWKWDDRSMHFHTAWHYEAGLKTPPERDWNYVHVDGRGVYAGDLLNIFNPVATWYGEGDEKIWIDGESFPSHMGTGTEDYYGYSYAPKPVFQTPFNNLVRIDESMTQGHNVMSRTRNLDAIPFEKSLQFDIELIAWKPTTMIYAATTYWYAFPGAKCNIAPEMHEAALPIPTQAEAKAQETAAIPHRAGAIECETMKIVGKSDAVSTNNQDMEPWGKERWSGGRQLTVKASTVGDFIDIEAPAPDDKPRLLLLYVGQAPDYSNIGFTVNGEAVTTTFDGYAEKVQPAGPLKLGLFKPKDGKFVLRATVTGFNAKSNGPTHFFGLDCVVLE